MYGACSLAPRFSSCLLYACSLTSVLVASYQPSQQLPHPAAPTNHVPIHPQVQSLLGDEHKLALALNASGFKVDAVRVLRRVKVLQEEVASFAAGAE